MAVRKRPDESTDSLIKRFKKEVIKSEILKELRKREYYVAPSEKRRRKSQEAQRRARKKLAKVKQY